MREPQSKTIKDAVYTVNQLPPKQALDLLMDIVKMVGPALAPVLAGLQGKLDKDVVEVLKADFINEAVKTLFNNMDKGTVIKLIDQLAAVTTLSFPGGDTAGVNLKVAFDAHFRGNLGALMQWLPFALQVQYADPLGDLGNVIATFSPIKAISNAAAKA